MIHLRNQGSPCNLKKTMVNHFLCKIRKNHRRGVKNLTFSFANQLMLFRSLSLSLSVSLFLSLYTNIWNPVLERTALNVFIFCFRFIRFDLSVFASILMICPNGGVVIAVLRVYFVVLVVVLAFWQASFEGCGFRVLLPGNMEIWDVHQSRITWNTLCICCAKFSVVVHR